jgi:hypothetical protein
LNKKASAKAMAIDSIVSRALRPQLVEFEDVPVADCDAVVGDD